MSNRTPDSKLRPMPLPPGPKPLPPFQAAGSYDRPEMIVSPGLARSITTHLASHYLVPLRAQRPATFDVLVGPPNGGKTETVRVVVSRCKVDLISRPASDLAGATEGASVRALEACLADAETIRAARGLPIAIVWDDFDTSPAAVNRDNREYTVNSELLAGRMQKLADDVLDGAPLPIILTCNELPFRSALFRDGRARTYVHVPGIEETARAAAAIFGAVTEADGQRVGAFVAANPDLPIGWYAVHRSACLDKAIDEVVAAFGIVGADAEAAIAKRMAAVTLDDLLATAEARPVITAKSHL